MADYLGSTPTSVPIAPITGTTQSQNSNSTLMATTGYVDRLAPRGWIDGLNGTTTASSATFGVSIGQARSDDNTITAALASAFTKTTAAFVTGTGNGSFDGTGSSASTTLFVYLIWGANVSPDILTARYDTATPTLPSGFTKKRRIDAFKTNGSSQATKAQTRFGDYVYLTVPVLDVNADTIGATSKNYVLSVPLGINVDAMFSPYLVNGSGGGLAYLYSPALAQPAFYNLTCPSAGQSNPYNAVIRTDTSGQITVNSITAGNVFYASTQGWIDRRGKDA